MRNPDGISVDWVAKNLYWCDKTTDTIEVSHISGRYRKVLTRDGLQDPRGLAVNPYKGFLFYSDWGDRPHIGKTDRETSHPCKPYGRARGCLILLAHNLYVHLCTHTGRMGMDGSERRVIISEHMGWPNALTIDYVTERIIWADARLDYIAFADLNGEGMQYVIQEHLPHVFAITVFEDYIYWTDWEFKVVERAHKFTGLDRSNISSIIHRPMDIQVRMHCTVMFVLFS